MIRITILATLLSLALGARHLMSSSAVKSEGREFDYFMFVRQWPGNFCSQHACRLLHERGYHFTIHGLWPNYNDGTWPQFCDPNYKFDVTEVEDLEEVLEEEWPTFYDNNEDFWEHEWSKHGTCALNLFPNEHKYFKTILKLHWKYDLAAAFRAANILPSHDKVYTAKQLEDAVELLYGARPVIHCFEKKLNEIWMCFDKNLQPFNCDPKTEHDTCSELTIPPLPSLAGNEAADKETYLQDELAAEDDLGAEDDDQEQLRAEVEVADKEAMVVA